MAGWLASVRACVRDLPECPASLLVAAAGRRRAPSTRLVRLMRSLPAAGLVHTIKRLSPAQRALVWGGGVVLLGMAAALLWLVYRHGKPCLLRPALWLTVQPRCCNPAAGGGAAHHLLLVPAPRAACCCLSCPQRARRQPAPHLRLCLLLPLPCAARGSNLPEYKIAASRGFELEGALGSGHFGRVYKARSRSTGQVRWGWAHGCRPGLRVQGRTERLAAPAGSCLCPRASAAPWCPHPPGCCQPPAALPPIATL